MINLLQRSQAFFIPASMLKQHELVYIDPAREVDFWRPTPEALLALGFRSWGDIPQLKELEEWFEAQKSSNKLKAFFQKTEKLASRRLQREWERRETVGSVEEISGGS
jgi:hypothetical protein